MIKIDKNVPLPKARNKFPLREMAIGDSFFVEAAKANHIQGSFAILRPMKFATRAFTENGVKGTRVWRIE